VSVATSTTLTLTLIGVAIMAINIKQVSNFINIHIPTNTIQIEQQDNKQLFIVILDNGVKLLVSYLTVIGFKEGDTWVINTRKYSVTTSKQTSWFSNKTSFFTDTRPNDYFIASLSKLLGIEYTAVERYLVSR
jgi:hypothetical protein